jgi:flagellar biosynthesis/type III secretory pathway protein FliH
MSSERIIPSAVAQDKAMEAFPYFPVDPVMALEAAEGESPDDAPIGSELSTPEEDAARLASVDHVIHARLQEAENQAQDIARQAYEDGFASGEAEGRSFGESQYRAYLQRLDEHLERFARIGDAFEKAVQDETVALALAVGEYLAAQQLEGPRANVADLVRLVLAAHPMRKSAGPPGGEALTVRMNPKDLEILGDRLVGFVGIRFVEDPELGRGSVHLESDAGVLDASMEQRRERLLELVNRLREAG